MFGRLLGANGKQFCGHDIGRDSGDNRAAEYTVHYSAGYATPNPPGEPAKWVLEIPTKVHEMKIPVYFKDLPLP